MSKKPHDFRVDPSPCPVCKAVLDCASEVTGKEVKPHKGDFTVCTRCAHILIFDRDRRRRLCLRLPRAAEVEAAEKDENWQTVLKAQRAIRVLRVEHPLDGGIFATFTFNPKKVSA